MFGVELRKCVFVSSTQLVSHLMMFLVILALMHAEEMINILIVDIADQKEREEYYELPMHANGETMNQVRFKSASQLAAGTLKTLYLGTAMVTLYLLCCLFLLCGSLRYRSQLMVPWLIYHACGAAMFFGAIIYYRKWFVMNLLYGSAVTFCEYLLYF